jgi:serine/threonine-protein kinase
MTGDDQVIVEPDLRSAIQRAIGSKGHVLLNNREPIKLTGNDAAMTIGGGAIYIRAAEGVRPVLEVEIQGPKPFLTTRTDAPLTLTGVTIVAHYGGKPRSVPAVVEAGASVRLDRCAFRATGMVQGSSAVAAEGKELAVDGCWFEGFDMALDIAAFAGSSTTIRQSMMVRARSGDPAIGWGVRVRKTLGGNSNASRRLSLEHCTIQGKGMLHLVDFSPQAALHVDVKECAVLADALAAWQTPKPGTPLTTDALDWKGEGNQYDIRGQAWVVLSPAGTPELPDGPTDLASWRSKAAEHDPLPPPIKFRVAPDALSESPQPGDFAIIDQDIRPPGADPKRVGPAATGRQ